MNLNNLLAEFGLIFLLKWFLLFFFVGQIIFLLIVGRQIVLMENLFKTSLDFFLRVGNWLLLALSVLGLLILLFTIL